MAQRSCIFCRAQGSLTREHVIPGWLPRYIGGDEMGSFRGTHLSAIGMPLSVRTASKNSHTLNTVCATCNNGWMSDLESTFGRLLPRLQADMSPRQFSKAERRIIALWIVKTGIIAHYSSNYRTILPLGVPHSLSQGRVVPAGVKVFGGVVDSGKDIRWIQSNIGVAHIRPSDISEIEAGEKTFVFALSIQNIFIGFSWHGLSQKDFNLTYTDSSVHRIYPHPESARNPRVLEDIMLATTQICLRRRRP